MVGMVGMVGLYAGLMAGTLQLFKKKLVPANPNWTLGHPPTPQPTILNSDESRSYTAGCSSPYCVRVPTGYGMTADLRW